MFCTVKTFDIVIEEDQERSILTKPLRSSIEVQLPGRPRKDLMPRGPIIIFDSRYFPVPFKRTQFTLRLAYAMTINKSQR